MKKVFMFILASLFFLGFWQTVLLYLPHLFSAFFLFPCAVVFIVCYFSPLELIFTSIFLGVLTDALTGNPIGATSIINLGVSVGFRASNIFSFKDGKLLLLVFIFYASVVYRLVHGMLWGLFGGNSLGFSFKGMLFGPLIDSLVGFIFIYFLYKLFFLIKFIDNETKTSYLA